MTAFLRERGGNVLIWADAGTQKTMAAIVHCTEANYKTVLILCPKTAKKNWENELQLAGADAARFTIENYEALISARATTLLKPWDCIIADECQLISHWKNKTTKRFHKLPAAHRIALSGTPWKNSIWEAHSCLHWIEPGCLGKTWWEFRTRFLIFNPYIPGAITGVRDEWRIQKVIDRLSIRIRRDEPAVKAAMGLPDLVSREHRFALSVAEERALAEIRRDALLTLRSGEKLMTANVLAALTRTRQVVDCPSVLGIAESGTKEAELAKLLEDPARTIIFSPFAKAMEILAARHGGLLLTGKQDEAERNETIRAFQQGENKLLFITQAGGTAINLTLADRVIFYSLPYSWADVDQVTARAHRRGRSGSVERVFLLATGSADDKLYALVRKKKKLTMKDMVDCI